MTLTIYRSKRFLYTYVGDPPEPYAIEWDEWAFEPTPRRRWKRSNSENIHERSDPYPLAVGTPPLAKIVNDRLAFHGDPIGIGAESVAYLAFRGARGFRLAANEGAAT